MNMILWAGLVVASVLDWKYRKIPNWLTFSLILSGLVLSAFSGRDAMLLSVYGLVFGTLLLFIPFAFGGMGGGDVKLLAAIGAFVGPGPVIQVFLIGTTIGGVFCALAIVREKAWRKTFANMGNRIAHLCLTHKFTPEHEPVFPSAPIRIPYAFMLSLGYLWTYFLGGH